MSFKLPEIGSVVSYLPPCAMVSPISGKRYIVPWWIELDEDKWEEQLEVAMRYYHDKIKNNKLPSKQNVEIRKWKVKDYEVTENNGKWSCTCVGYQFRRDCKHIQSIRDNKPMTEKPVKKATKTKTITGPNGEIYIIGQRGRKPKWLLELENNKKLVK